MGPSNHQGHYQETLKPASVKCMQLIGRANPPFRIMPHIISQILELTLELHPPARIYGLRQKQSSSKAELYQSSHQ